MSVSIFLGTPMYGGVCHGPYIESVLEAKDVFAKQKWGFEFSFIYHESLVTRARNEIVQSFLETDSTHLLFIDADIAFNPNDVVKMVKEDKALIGGVYPYKKINWDNIAKNAKEGKDDVFDGLFTYNIQVTQEQEENRSEGVSECLYLANGYMLIKREVFEKVKVDEYTSNNTFSGSEFLMRRKIKNYFDTSIDFEHDVLLSEDQRFCNLWRETGGKTYFASYARAAHIGNQVYGHREYGTSSL